MFWLPFVTVTSSIFGGLIERLLGEKSGASAWLLRLILPLLSGCTWFALTEVTRVDQVHNPWFDFGMFTVFSFPAWVGVYAVRRARMEE
jgi:hypothetical protein